MAGWRRVSCSWEKTAALNNLWPCWPSHCSLHCPCTSIQLHCTHRDWLALFSLWPVDPCVFRDKQPVPGTLRMVGWWTFIKEQCKLSKRERRRCLGICLEPLPVPHWLSPCLFTILSLSLLLWHQTTNPSRQCQVPAYTDLSDRMGPNTIGHSLPGLQNSRTSHRSLEASKQ